MGGYIEVMPGVKPFVIMDEEGHLKGKPTNPFATQYILKALHGKILRYSPTIVGDVLIFDPGEKL